MFFTFIGVGKDHKISCKENETPRDCSYTANKLASFPGRFGREKRPGNFRDFKLYTAIAYLIQLVKSM